MIRALVVLLALAGPLRAQELRYDGSLVTGCDAEACAMEAAEACIADSPGNGATPVMAGCFDRALGDWDTRLNAAYGAARARAVALDGDGVPAPEIGPGLLEMQRKWIPWRDASCSFAALQWRGGTGAGPAYLACLTETTARQALRLEAFGEGQ